MHRCLVESVDWDHLELSLSSEEAHHLVHVLRVRDGDHVIICDGTGGEAEGVVTSAAVPGAEVRLLAETIRKRSQFARLWLFQALPKGKRMDVAVAKASELGATDIVPVETDRVVVRLETAQAERKVARWQRIAEEAAKQCGSPWVTRVHAVTPLPEALEDLGEGAFAIVGALDVGAPPICRVLAERQAVLSDDLALFIGPEGDFTPEELESICAAGAVPVSFGSRVLRTETAAIYGLSVLAAARDALD